MRSGTPTAPAAAALLACVCARVLVACVATPISEQHPSVQRAPASHDTSLEERRATVRRTAESDLACAKIDVVLALDRRYDNRSSIGFVVEGCGKRAVYAESCEDYPRCRYLVVSILQLPVDGGVPTP